ncbi:MAG: Tol-Pal system beta propeller repeat protein TolB [Pseudomonadota bacterium]
MNSNRLLQVFLTFLGLIVLQSASATINLELTQGVGRAIPIAIVPFHGDSLGISKVLRQDLLSSGMFSITAVDKLPNKPGTIADVQFGDWRAIPVNDLIIGTITPEGNNYHVSFTLLDTFKSQQFLHFSSLSQATVNANLNPVLAHQVYTIPKSSVRFLAHHIADIIYKQLTGVPGVFSTRIAYVAVKRFPDRPTKYALDIANADGEDPQPLLQSNSPLMSPAWSPDGKSLAYVSFENRRSAIYISDLSTGKRRLVAQFSGINSAPAWSPDGKELALALSKGKVNTNIYILNLVNNKLEQLTTGSFINTSPAWSPDGKSIIFTSNREKDQPQIYKIDLATNAIKRITFNGNYNAHASFTPDGNNIVILHRDGGKFEIAIQNLATGNLKVLTDSGLNDSPSISPNGQMIIYATYYQGKETLAKISMNGLAKTHLISNDSFIQSPAWGPLAS